MVPATIVANFTQAANQKQGRGDLRDRGTTHVHS